ncbi:FadR/GntR family transcriptional regulator [Streptomyces sp. KL116D]|uniref:FadR/GntR family transcriptional regulator n=1 Tax=Streptomyces sp. KL116D TaxID=3045152 RepID=UPI003556C91E
MNLVVSRRRVGVTVRPAEEWNVYDPRVIRWRLAGSDRPRQLRSLTVLRSAVEPVAAGLAARDATRPGSARNSPSARSAWSPRRAATQLEAYLVHDIEFHRVVLNASGNEMFAHLSATWWPRCCRPHPPPGDVRGPGPGGGHPARPGRGGGAGGERGARGGAHARDRGGRAQSWTSSRPGRTPLRRPGVGRGVGPTR